MKNYQVILWDWDGCLAKTLEVWLKAYKTVFAEYGIFPQDKEITEKVFGNWDGPKKLGVKDINTFTKRLLKITNKELTNVRLYDSAKETLQILKERGKKQALLTSSKKASVYPALVKNDLKKFFEVILTEEDVTNHKPNPEIIKKAIVKLGGSKRGAIIIGDSKKDLEAAQNAQIDSVLFHNREHNPFFSLKVLKSYQPTFIIKNLKEVIDILRSN